jgi:diguanylate cyclase (GGDEF)-like protein
MLEPDFSTDPPLILIVEDEATLRLLYRRVLMREGYELQEASNGEQCLEICSHRVPDLILLDAKMPTMDGFTCCEELQKKLGTDCPPILIVTILDDEESVELAFEKGATEYITKPINWAVFRQRISRLLKTHWAFQELQRRYQEAEELSQQLVTANQKLKLLATVDGLTQVANRRMFDERLQEEWHRACRQQLPLSLILCDIDYFKRYNDHYGHQAGDACLVQVASILQQNCQRSEDLVARYGGEEFGIILSGSHLEEANCVAQRIRTQLQETAIPHAKNPNQSWITLSMGVASMIPQNNVQEADLVAQADRALYQAKIQGRNQAVTAAIGEE